MYIFRLSLMRNSCYTYDFKVSIRRSFNLFKRGHLSFIRKKASMRNSDASHTGLFIIKL